MSQTIRWGILGTGNIAKQFARGLKDASDAELAAVGSRTGDTADAFGDEFDVPRRHASYEALAADKDIDAIYVSTPHMLHKDNTLLCLAAGKAVLCEKPFTINAAEAAEAIALARAQKIFLMEAMWTRYLPAVVKVRELIAAGAIGEVRMVLANFAFRGGWNPERRLLNPAMGGGGLLDVGIYPISFAGMILGEAKTVASHAHLGETGVDEQAGIVLGYDTGALAVLSCGVRITTPHDAIVCGTDGRIQVHAPFWRGQKLTLTSGKDTEEIELPFRGNGYTHEAEEVGTCLRAGKLESDVLPLDETLSIMKTLDAIRAQWGLKYPME